MRERPILFNSEMVRAILDGRKTQTRRVAKIDLGSWLDGQADKIDESDLSFSIGEGHSGFGLYVSCTEYPEEGSEFFKCPFGKPGDRLWVRETWRRGSASWHHTKPENSEITISYKAGGVSGFITRPYLERLPGDSKSSEGWVPSIHMPRWASRITLEIKNVRAERLNDISNEDALSEGMTPCPTGAHECQCQKNQFQFLWAKLYGNNPSNPWVWVYEFEVIK